jgi:DNA-binding NarL/FixJ family response regulator
VDPKSLIRKSLGSWLAAGLTGYMVELASDAEEALVMARDVPSTALVIYNIGGRRTTCPQVTVTVDRLTRDLPKVPVAIMADAEDREAVTLALRAGARGYIPTNLNASAAVEVVRLICAGEIYVPAASLLDEAPAAVPVPTAPGGFSARQIQIIQCLRRGIPNKCIAYELVMSLGTVKVHIRNIMKKLGAQNRTQVVMLTNHLTLGVGQAAALPAGWRPRGHPAATGAA